MPLLPAKSQSSNYSLSGYGDSISRFDTSRDIYSTKATPIQQKRANSVPSNKKIDSMETSSEKNDRIAPVKIMPKNVGVAGDQAVKIARAGRYVFFAIAGPPFFLLFSLPKFTLNVVLPMIFQQLNRISFQVKKIFKSVNEMVSKFILNPVRNLLGNIRLKTAGIQKIFSSLLAYISLPIKNMLPTISKSLTKAFNAAIKPFNNFVKVVREKVSNLAKESSKILSKSLKSLSTTFAQVAQPMINFATTQFAKITTLSKNGLEGLKKVLKKPIFKKVFQSVSNVMTKVQNFMPQLIQIAQPIMNFFIPTFQIFKKAIEQGVHWIKDKPKKHFSNLLQKGKKAFSFISPTLNQTYDLIMKYVKGYFTKALEMLLAFILWICKKVINLIFICYPAFEKNLDKGKKIQFYFKDKFKNGMAYIKGFWNKIIGFVQNQFKKMMEAPKDYFLSLLKKCLSLVSKSFKFVALICIAICLVFKYWFEMLFELSEHLSQKLTNPKLSHK